MAEFVEKRCQDMIPALEEMKRIKLFDENEIRSTVKELKQHECKIQRQTKCKEDYLRYIQYEYNLLKLIKQRKDKYGIPNKLAIDYAVTDKMNSLYKDAIYKFQDDIRFWIAYMKFCKHVHFHSNIDRMLGRMLQVHKDKPKCWHIAATWELEENKNKQSARQYLLRGLQIHPYSQLLYIDAFKLELDRLAAAPNAENTENQEDDPVSVTTEMPLPLKTAFIIYQQAFDRIKDIKFIVELLNITKKYDNIEQLQKRIIDDMLLEYAHEPLMWDTMARRELQGLVQPGLSDTPMEVDNAEQISLRSRITSCNKVYKTAVQKIKTEEMWSLYIDCLLEINRDLRSLPNFKRKLLKTALMRAHQEKKLKEEHYLHWINMLSADKEHDESVRKKLDEVLRGATDAIPNSVSIWHARLNHMLQSGQEEEAYNMFPKMTEILGEKALPLWKMRILHAQIKSSEEAEESFQAALQLHPLIAKDLKPMWLEWLVLTKGICEAREAYESLWLELPASLEFHEKMIALELMQPKTLPEHVRRPYELATLQFGTNNTSLWLDYIKYEMKHGDPKRTSDIYERAVKTLNDSLKYSFISGHSQMTSKPDSIK